MGSSLVIAAFFVGSWFPISGGTWTPDQGSVAKLQAALPPYVVAQASGQHRKLQPWSSYSFQFQGRGNAGGKFIFTVAKESGTATVSVTFSQSGKAASLSGSWQDSGDSSAYDLTIELSAS